METAKLETLLINILSDCILINHLGIATDKTLFTAFENLCYLLGLDFYEIDPILYKQLDHAIKSVRLETKDSNTEIMEDLIEQATLLLPHIKQIVNSYN